MRQAVLRAASSYRFGMPIPPPIDPRLLAAEIEACLAEFNRLAAFATSIDVAVESEIRWQSTPDAPRRPVLSVRIVSSL